MMIRSRIDGGSSDEGEVFARANNRPHPPPSPQPPSGRTLENDNLKHLSVQIWCRIVGVYIPTI